LQDADLDELDEWAPKLVAKLQGVPQLADVTSDQQANAASATLMIDRDRGGTFRHPAGADRRDDLRRHWPE
jgi:multidrug efflux pump subunit AcrB